MENHLIVKPKLKSKLHYYLGAIFLVFLIETKIPEYPVSLGTLTKIPQLKHKVNLEHSEIYKGKKFLELLIALLVWREAMKVMARKYELDLRSFRQNEGLFVQVRGAIDLTLITDSEVTANAFERMLGLATLKVISKDTTTPEFIVRGLDSDDANEMFDFLRENSVNSVVEELVKRRIAKDTTMVPFDGE